MIKRISMLLIPVLLVVYYPVAFGQSKAHKNTDADPTHKHRYEPVTNDVFGWPAYNGDPSMLNGYAEATADELGITGTPVLVEYPGAPRVFKLVGHAVLYHDAASKQIFYIRGCEKHVGGKVVPWPNRIKPAEKRELSAISASATAVAVAGRDGKDGRDGRDGKDGKDGRDGVDGEDGADGRDGKDAHLAWWKIGLIALVVVGVAVGVGKLIDRDHEVIIQQPSPSPGKSGGSGRRP